MSLLCRLINGNFLLSEGFPTLSFFGRAFFNGSLDPVDWRLVFDKQIKSKFAVGPSF